MASELAWTSIFSMVDTSIASSVGDWRMENPGKVGPRGQQSPENLTGLKDEIQMVFNCMFKKNWIFTSQKI